MATLLEWSMPPTAVFAMSDEMAFGALTAFDERSLQPGVDMSIMGVDDHPRWPTDTRPSAAAEGLWFDHPTGG